LIHLRSFYKTAQNDTKQTFSTNKHVKTSKVVYLSTSYREICKDAVLFILVSCVCFQTLSTDHTKQVQLHFSFRMSRTIISLALILNITQGTANRLKAVIPSTTRGSRTHSPLCTAGCWSSECSVLHLQLAAVWIIVCGLVVGVIGTFV